MNNKRLFYFVQISFWLIYFSLSAWVFTNFLSLKASILRSFANVFPLLILFYINVWNINTFFEKKKIVTAVFVGVGLFVLFIPIRYFININPIFNPAIFVVNKTEATLGGILITNLLILAFSTFYQTLVNKFQKNRLQSEEIQIYQTAQLNYLRSQINPHFLFNTLNNIYSLALKKSENTPKMVLKLSEILRYVVYQDNDKLILLDDEITLIQHFIDLTKMKFETTPNIVFKVSGNTKNLQIEPMIIIPIIENCFKHSDIDTNETGFINIQLLLTKNTLHFTTENSKNNALSQKDNIGGVGLMNIKKRLYLTHKNKYRLDITDKKTSFKVTLNLELTHAKT